MTLPHNLPITPAGYREIYRTMLQDVYDWAGQDRWVDTGRTGPFCKAAFIIPELDKRFAAINAENDLRGLGAEAFAERAAEHEIDLARIDPQAWNAASIAGFHKQDYRPMRDVIAGALAERGR